MEETSSIYSLESLGGSIDVDEVWPLPPVELVLPPSSLEEQPPKSRGIIKNKTILFFIRLPHFEVDH